jgi:hypothetical protein
LAAGVVRTWLVESAWGEDLHIIVERRVSVFVFVKEPVRVVHTEVLKMKETVGVVLPHELHESVAL